MIIGIRNTVSYGSRLFHTTCYCRAVEKAALSKLRKKTRFGFDKCKKALEKCDNDLVLAEKWLREQAQKEGWAKANKLADRPMSQGLIGVLIEKDSAAMVEINCETDFVSRNDKFQKLVSTITASCMDFGSKCQSEKVYLGRPALASVPVKEGGTVGDSVALMIGNIGENMLARRAVYMKAPSDCKLAYYIHTTGNPSPGSDKHERTYIGKFASLLTYRKLEPPTLPPATEGEDVTEEAPKPIAAWELGRQLCQHIVGMNPKCVGLSPDEEPCKNKDDETAMLHQEFLMDTSVTVREVLQENHMEVLDFVRFQCGEELAEEEEAS